jgi:ABC-type sugar transport system permease subunit
MADIAHTPLAGAGSIPTQSASQSSLLQRIWRAKRYYLYLVPIFALLGIFSYYPPLMALYYSLSNFNGVQLRLIDLFQDRLFLTSVGNVLKLMVANVLTGLIPPLLAAELIFLVRSQRAANFYRTMFLIPTLVPAMVVILTWRYIYHARYGLINTVLDGIGLDSLRHDWLGSFDTALLSLMFFGFPWIYGASLLILLAGLINIPNEIFDSYRMDAGWGIRRIWHIDLPLILGAVRLVIVLAIINTLQGLTLQFALTGGGPGNATMVPAYYMYREAFFNSRFGYASAIGVVLFLVVLGATFVNLRFVRSDVEYEPDAE